MATEPLVFDAIGTRWQIDIDEPLPTDRRVAVFDSIRSRIAVFDKDYSRFRDDSLVSEMARRTGTYELPADAAPMMDVYRRLYDITEGKFTPLIGQTLVDAGYDAAYSLQPKTLRVPPSWDAAMSYRFPTLEMKTPALLDFGAAGKGYLIDIVGGMLEERGIRSFCIDAGQDILYRSTEPRTLRVGLEHPGDVSQVIGVATIADGSICGSSGNRRRWADFHHIIDPKLLASPKNLLACWATAKTALVADAMTTALFFVGPEKLLPHFEFDYLCLRPDLSVERSPAFPAELFVA